MKDEKDLEAILGENGFHSILYHKPHQKIIQINCNPSFLNKENLNKNLGEYIIKKLTAIDDILTESKKSNKTDDKPNDTDTLLKKYTYSSKINTKDTNRYVALLELAVAVEKYEKKLKSEDKLRKKTRRTNFEFAAVRDVFRNHSGIEINISITEELLAKEEEKNNIFKETLRKEQDKNNLSKNDLISKISSLEETYKNDNLKNDIDDIFNIAFSTITSLASSLLCCGSQPSRPKTTIYVTQDIKATILSDGKVKQRV